MITIVTGLPRCGSTLVMRMLVAGGLQPSSRTDETMEDTRALWLPKRWKWLHAEDHRAIKILDPVQYHLPPDLDYRFIFLTREPVAHAASQARMARMVGIPCSTLAERSLAGMIASKTHAIRATLPPLGEVCEVSFESLLSAPESWARTISWFVGANAAAALAMSNLVRRTG